MAWLVLCGGEAERSGLARGAAVVMQVVMLFVIDFRDVRLVFEVEVGVLESRLAENREKRLDDVTTSQKLVIWSEYLPEKVFVLVNEKKREGMGKRGEKEKRGENKKGEKRV